MYAGICHDIRMGYDRNNSYKRNSGTKTYEESEAMSIRRTLEKLDEAQENIPALHDWLQLFSHGTLSYIIQSFPPELFINRLGDSLAVGSKTGLSYRNHEKGYLNIFLISYPLIFLR